MNEKEDFLGTAPVGRLLLKLALPTVAAQIINMMYNIVDRIYIGHIPNVGSLALTGVGVCMPLIMIVSAFAALVSNGGAPRASIALGQGNREAAQKILGNCFTLQIIVSIVLTFALVQWNDIFLMLFGASENTIEYATSYMNIYALGTIFVQMTLGMNAFITAQGFTKVSMLSVLIGAITNIILDPILIFGFNMGVRGAALATVISQSLSCIWVVSFLVGRRTKIRLSREFIGIQPQIILPCLALGLSMFVMQASESVIAICFNASLLRYGGDIAVGAMTILTSVMQFANLPLQGFGQGAQPILSYNFGARKPDRVKKTFQLLLLLDVSYATILWAAIMIAPQMFISLFTSEQALIEFSRNALRIYLAVLCIFSVQMACQMAFTSLGNAKASIMVAVMRKFILLIPLIYIMPALIPNHKTMAVYLAEPIADFCSVVFTVVLFSMQFKKALNSIRADEANGGAAAV